ncbi:hypothetical protein T06_3279 [Trichinella sp. T6]|nr:hypothetical protein T06_3279 [Trichinella sp. T6]
MNWTGVLRPAKITTKTEEEIEEFLTSHEANDEESLNSDGKNYEENESNIMKHFSETFYKSTKRSSFRAD